MVPAPLKGNAGPKTNQLAHRICSLSAKLWAAQTLLCWSPGRAAADWTFFRKPLQVMP